MEIKLCGPIETNFFHFHGIFKNGGGGGGGGLVDRGNGGGWSDSPDPLCISH